MHELRGARSVRHVMRPPFSCRRAAGVRRVVGLPLNAVVALLAFLVAAPAGAQLDWEEEPILYGEAPPDDAISRLQSRIDRDEVTLSFHEGRGYLDALLDALEVPRSSQMLVFSKTSLQQKLISPRSPRAIYFRDDLYIGWVRGGEVLEVSAVDPGQGAVFYTLAQRRRAKPRFERRTHECTQCHGSTLTGRVPGHIIRSVYPAPDGFPVLSAGTFRTDQTSPFEERWGGWYVTGTHGDGRHMGNVVLRDRADLESLDREAGANVVDLAGRFDGFAYPTPHSDIVALLVLEHQAVLHNLITRASFETRLALHQQDEMNRALGEDEDHVSASTRRRIERVADDLLEYMLFAGEAELPAPIEGTSSFARDFSSKGPRDRKGRSLRELDLERRLFEYPLSYLIYSRAFRELPAPVRDRVLRRLWEVLTGIERDPELAGLSKGDRSAILEILRDTCPDLPDYWRADPEPEKPEPERKKARL